MRNLVTILIIALFAGLATWLLPWWTAALVVFIIAVAMQLRPGKAFLLGAAGIVLLWLVVILCRDIPNDHILSARMAKLFSLPHFSIFILVNLVIGALIGGLSGWAGGLMNRAFRRK